MKQNIKSILALTVICGMVAVLLAVTNAITAPIIEKNESAAANEALLVVLPDGKGFTSIDLSSYKLPATVTEAFTEENGGVVVKLKTSGYGSDMIIMVGIGADGKVTGAVCLSSNETLGAEKTYGDTAKGFAADTIDTLDTVAGATMTTSAYKNAIKDALNTAIILGGGTVDLRDEAQKLADNLAAALPAAEGNFNKLFLSVTLKDVSAVYEAVNGKGFVFVSGENFVATDAQGKVISSVDATLKATIEANAQLVIKEKNSKTPVDLTKYELPATVTEAFTTDEGDTIIKLKTSGYGSDMILMVSINAEGKVESAECISSNETLGYEKTYGEKVKGATTETIGSIDTVSGATMTTTAYKNAVKDALNAAIIIGGGSVDIRDEAQILADNLAAALPDAEGGFEKVFIAEVLTDVTAVYKATNGKGYVFVSGENFIGTDANGNVVSEVDATVADAIAADVKLIVNSKITEINLDGYKMPKQIEKAYKTSTGNYIFDLKASGFGINGDEYYNPSGEHIKITVSLTSDGKIIACETTYQNETNGLGSVCGDESFYSQFDGKTEDNYKDIEAIAGATITTNGYKTAISKTFEAIKILKGEG